MRRVLSSLIIAAALAGCAAYPVGAPHGGNLATLLVKPVVGPASGYQTLAQVVPYGSGDINHLVIQLFTLSGDPAVETAVLDGSGAPEKVDLAAADLGKTVTFTDVSVGKTYRLRAYAYKAAGEAAADLISTDDDRSYVDVPLTSAGPQQATLKVGLIDKTFDGQTSSTGILVTSGGLQMTTNNATQN